MPNKRAIVLCIFAATIIGCGHDIYQNPQPEDVPRLIDVLKHDTKHREDAVAALTQLGEPAVNDLVELLDDPAYASRDAASRVLVQLGELAVSALAPALEAQSKTAEFRSTVLQVLERIGPDQSQSALDSLVRLLADNRLDVDERESTLQFVRRIDREASVRVVRLWLDEDNANVRILAADSLSKTGNDDDRRKAATRVFELIESQALGGVAQRERAVETLAKLNVDRTLVILSDWLDHEDPQTCLFAAAKYYELDAPAAQQQGAGRRVVKLLEDDDVSIRRKAAETLGGFLRDAMSIVPSLIEALTDSDRHVRINAAGSLGRLGEAARSSLPSLLHCVNSNASDSLVVFAVQAIKKIDPEYLDDHDAQIAMQLQFFVSESLESVKRSAAASSGEIVEKSAAFFAAISLLEELESTRSETEVPSTSVQANRVVPRLTRHELDLLKRRWQQAITKTLNDSPY